MSKLKLPTLYFAPLCLKLHGRIVGAVSRMHMAIYIGLGLLILSSILLMILVTNMKNTQNPDIRSEQTTESPVVENLKGQPIVTAVMPAPSMSKVDTKQMNKDEVDDSIKISKSIEGAIQLDFGWQFHQVYNDWRYHTGIDISGPAGQSVEAIYGGQVIDIFRDKHSGLTVVIKNKTYIVYYGSLSEVVVSKDSLIHSGQTIGTIGSCTGEPYNHLHLAMKKGERYIDPKLIIHKD